MSHQNTVGSWSRLFVNKSDNDEMIHHARNFTLLGVSTSLRKREIVHRVILYRRMATKKPETTKRRRPRRPLHKKPSIITARDSRRQFIETNRLPGVMDQVLKGANRHKLVSRALGRLEWVRESFSRMLNQHYNPGIQEKFNPGPNMDDPRWYFWNVMFALTPALFVAVVCEFWLQPRMLKATEKAQRDYLMGNYGEEDRELIEEVFESMKERQGGNQSWTNFIYSLFSDPVPESDPPVGTLDQNTSTHSSEIDSKQPQKSNHDTLTGPPESDETEVQELRRRVEQLEIAILKEKRDRMEKELQRMQQTSLVNKSSEAKAKESVQSSPFTESIKSGILTTREMIHRGSDFVREQLSEAEPKPENSDLQPEPCRPDAELVTAASTPEVTHTEMKLDIDDPEPNSKRWWKIW